MNFRQEGALVEVTCRCCGAPTARLWQTSLLGRDVPYFECATCEYVQTEQPTWLAQAYSSSINLSDTGILRRNQLNVSWVVTTLASLGRLDRSVVDFAGGYGLLVRMLRDVGIEAHWMDRYSDNLVARGFEHHDGGTAELVTAFEAFEHFVDPVAELEAMLKIAPNVLLSTLLIPKPTPPADHWWYYGLEHGQHVGFFRRATLEYLARRFDKVLFTNGVDYHLFAQPDASARRWYLMTRLRRLVCPLLCTRLSPKTDSDHATLAVIQAQTHD